MILRALLSWLCPLVTSWGCTDKHTMHSCMVWLYLFTFHHECGLGGLGV